MNQPPSEPPRLLAGIDIGGTKLGLCVGTSRGEVLAAEHTPMDHERSPEEILTDARARLADIAAAANRRFDEIAAVGAACPGPLNYAAGAFINPPNMPRWHGFGIRDWLKSSFSVPTAMMNDANATALAEHRWGAARGSRTAVYLTMSTGMGAGLIIDGRLYEGPAGLAGEIGHLRLGREDAGPVGFGRRGSVEGYCSGPGMLQLARDEALACAQRGEATALREIDEFLMTPDDLMQASWKGDAAARRVTDRICDELGRLMAVMTDILNPEVFVLGTIGTKYAPLIIPRAMATLMEEALLPAVECLKVVPSGLPHRGDQSALAVALGALGEPRA